ncbi:MAG TPA: ABC transporter permease [Puia sp.]|nr:ABC transporter permease [Puia sp.]
MLKNYLKTAWRNIGKNKLFSAINILGLSIGIALCFAIMLYVQDELSYDKFNANADDIVRVAFDANINGGKIFETSIMAPVAQTMKKDFPEVVDAARLTNFGSAKIKIKEKVFKDDKFALVDPAFFTIFSLPLIEGNAKTALLQPNSVILTETTAKKYFGDDHAMGKTIVYTNNNNQLYKVTGVMKDIPSNSHFHFDLFGSMTGLDQARSDSWMNGSFFTYLLLKPGTDRAKMEAKFPDMVRKYMGPQVQQSMGISLEQFRTKGNSLGFILQRLTSIHLHSTSVTDLEPGGNSTYVYVFAGIALFMLIVACINFINLSTASASKRAKEVGIRKVSGSDRFQLIRQFLSESMMIAMIALIIAFVMVKLALPAFNNISGKPLTLDIKPVLAFVALGILVGLVAGIYPAFYLSSFKPIDVLKGKFTPGKKNFGLRSGLVLFQFFISVGLIIGTIVVYQQMKFIQNTNLGYDKTQLITIPDSYALGKNEQVYKNEMLKDPRIINAAISRYKPAGPTQNNNALAYPQGNDNLVMSSIEYRVDENYIPTMGMHMLTGRNFSKAFSTDSFAIILNETAAKTLGFGLPNAVGKTVIRENSDRGTNIPFHVIGVVKNFNFKSLHETISPLVMVLEPEGGLIFKIKATDVNGLIATMKARWDTYNTGEPFTYSFIDDLFDKTYSAEQKTGTILNIFSVLTIFVACLGLFGLATYTAEQRTKEIGIRKVLGATVTQVTQMLSKEFLRLVFIASVIAFPFSWWVMNKWLQSFAYRINIRWWVFVVAGTGALLIALITVSWQAIKAAIANPAKSLRSE